jgi:hypothetical protein
MKSKVLFGLFVALLVLTLAPSSFAQVNLTISNASSEFEVETSHNVQTTDPESLGAGIVISGSVLAQSNLSTVFLTLTFADGDAHITSGIGANGAFLGLGSGGPAVAEFPADDAIRITGQTGLFANINSIWTIDFEEGTVTIALPSAVANNSSGSMSVVGVRLDGTELDPADAPFEVTAALNNAAGGYQIADGTATIIEALGPGIGSMAVGARSQQTSLGTFVIFTNRTEPDDDATFVIREVSNSAFRSATQQSTGGTVGTDGTQIRLTFAGVPSGITLNLTDSETSGMTGSLDDTTINSTDLVTTYTVTGTDLDDDEEIMIAVEVATSLTSTTPLAAGDITVTATLVAIGEGNDDNDLPQDTDYPRFEQADTTITIGSVIAANTTLLIPYAVVDNSILYDTGIALANTSLDPLTTGSATPGSGTIKLSAFPTTSTGPGTSFSFTTSATKRPGTGLSTDGTLAAGASWVVLLSNILTQEGVSGPFTGYIFLEASFLNAHGIVFISDFGAGPFNFTSFSPMLVLPAPGANGRTGGVDPQSDGVEDLSF